MSRGLTKKQMKKDEFVEAATDVGEWLEDNWKTVLIWVCGLALLVVIIFGWRFMSRTREAAAQELLGQGMTAFSAATDTGTGTTEDYNRAIDLFLQTSDKSGSGTTGMVAELYRGIALSKTGRTDEAITVLQDVSQNANFALIDQTAKAVLAGIHETNGDFEKAEAIYLELSTANDGIYPPAQAMLNAGMTRMAMGREAEARELLEELVRDFPQSPAAAQAGRLLDRQ